MAEAALAPPSVSVLWLRNLRMLDLDRLSDWPTKISPAVFKDDDVRTRKARIRRAEWIFYRLCEMWDPTETHDTLGAFFPALEPTQSLKLRSGILNLLARLKQDGLLGTCTIRKSLLDDCHGPRFEHLLLAFSTAVLQKRESSFSEPESEAMRLAMFQEPDNADADRRSFLSHAFQADLSRRLQAKQLVKLRTQGLEAYVHIKELTMQSQDELSQQTLAKLEHERAEAQLDSKGLKKKVRLAAGSDEAWANILLSGEPSRDRDPMIEDSFNRLWTLTQQGRDFQRHGTIEPGFLSDIEGRVGEQQERLGKFRLFQSQISQRNGDLIEARTPRESPRKTPSMSVQRSPTKSLRRVPPSRETPSPRKRVATQVDGEGAQSDAAVETASNNLHNAIMHNAAAESPSSPLKRATSLRQKTLSRQANQHVSAISDDLDTPVKAQSLRRRSKSVLAAYSPSPAKTSEDAESVVDALTAGFQQMDLGNKSLTLAERTRESMAFTNGLPDRASLSPRKAVHIQPDESMRTHDPVHNPGMAETLAERAQRTLQKSESAVEDRSKVHRSPTKSMQRRPKPRATPRVGPTDAAAPAGDADWLDGASMTPKAQKSLENMLLGTADAESVFKTRTRVRRSPPPAE